MRIIAGLLGLVAICTSASAGVVIYVDADATGEGDGSSWADAFVDLQAALASAQPGDEIWVAEGVYTPSDTNATASFQLRSGIALYGGFAGTENSRAQRDWTLHETHLSGDIGRDDVIGNGTFWYLNWERNTANVGHVLVGSGTDDTAIVDGFTIRNGATGPVGTPAGDPLMFGSGIYTVGGSPTIRNCTFLHNLAAFASGGAIYCLDASPTISRCVFLENYVHLGRGGGIFTGGNSAPAISDCAFVRNHVVSGTGDAMGAGIDHEGELPIEVARCRFEANVARSFYASSGDTAYGGGLASFWADITVRECEFVDNSAMIGGGMICWQSATVVNCLFRSNEAIPHPNDPFPEIGGFGGALLIYSFPGETLTVVNSTVAFNSAKKYAGILGEWNGTAVVRNSVVWGNIATHPDVHGYYREQIAGSFDIRYCDIQNIFGLPEPGGDPLESEKTVGCIDDDPLLAGPQDFHLSAGSPCIDAGENAEVPGWVDTDFDTLPRFVDDPATPDTGLGTPPIVDIGAFEFQVDSPHAPGDLNCDGSFDGADIDPFFLALGDPLAYAAQFPGCNALLGDMNVDGALDGADIDPFFECLGGGSCP